MKYTLVALSAAVLCVVGTAAVTAAAQDNRPNRRAGDAFHGLLLRGTGSIGVSVRDVTEDEAKKAKLSEATGAVVTVADGSEAARAGFQNGDIVLEFAGERVRSARQFARLVQESPVGRPVKAVVVREDTRRTVEVTPRARDLFTFTQPFDLPALQDRIRPFARDLTRELGIPARIAPGTVASPRRLGATLTTLNDQLGAYFGATTGALVLSVEPRSAAETAGLRGGDVITAVNGRAIRQPGEVAQALREASNGERVELKVLREKKEQTLTLRLD
jgi:S1-C subfamily serine protease